ELDRRRPGVRASPAAAAARRHGGGTGRRARAACGPAAQLAGSRAGPACAGAAGDRAADRRDHGGRPAAGAPRRGRPRSGVPAAGRRLRRDLRRQHRGAPARDDPHAAADGGRPDLRHVDARGQGRAHRGPVRQAAQLRHRRHGPALLSGRHGQRRRGDARGAPARSRAPHPRLRQRGGGDEPDARDHRSRPRRSAPSARMEHGLRAPVQRRRALRARRHGDRPQPAVHVGLRRRRQLTAQRRAVREPRDAGARLRALAAAARGRSPLPAVGPPAVDRRPHPPARRRPRRARRADRQSDRRQDRPVHDARGGGRARRADRPAARRRPRDAGLADGQREGARQAAADRRGGHAVGSSRGLAVRPDARQHRGVAERPQDAALRPDHGRGRGVLRGPPAARHPPRRHPHGAHRRGRHRVPGRRTDDHPRRARRPLRHRLRSAAEHPAGAGAGVPGGRDAAPHPEDRL
ncbi:MAG: 2-keto-3-deoxy-D-arabino-heptulosonate-7-phosphate synthase II, partial [uncultured Solirubrobacteraceae bacterium]